MTTLKMLAAASAVALVTILPAAAQQPAAPAPAAPAAPAPAAPPMPYGPPITVEKAEKAMAAAKAEAQKNNWPVAISIVDSGGHLVAFARMENTQTASIAIAHGKAKTAVEFRRPSKFFQDQLATGGAAVRFLAVPGLTPLEGGVPIVSDGKIIGGIGVSGVASSDDAIVAMAGANAAK
jgi:glc operon protein GlcG